MLRILSLLMSTIIVLLPSGCSVVALGVLGGPAYKYWAGKQQRSFEVGVPVAASSATQALTRMGIKTVKQEVTSDEALIRGETFDRESVHVRIFTDRAGTTITFRKSSFGDPELAGSFFTKLSEEIAEASADKGAKMLPVATEPDPPVVPR